METTYKLWTEEILPGVWGVKEERSGPPRPGTRGKPYFHSGGYGVGYSSKAKADAMLKIVETTPRDKYGDVDGYQIVKRWYDEGADKL